MAETRDLIIDALRAFPDGLSGGQVATAVPHLYAAQAGHILAAMAHDGLLVRHPTIPPRYALAPGLPVETTAARVAVDLVTGSVTDDPDVVDEIEAEKLWTLAGAMYDNRTGQPPSAKHIEWAAEMIEMARQHVRSARATAAFLRSDVAALDAPQP